MSYEIRIRKASDFLWVEPIAYSDRALRYFLLLISLIICGCETARLWQGNAQDEYIKIVPQSPSEDVESALKSSGREYYCQQLYASSYPNNKVCYAKLTAEEKIKNIEIKLFKTPETLAIDAAHTIKVVGYASLNILMHMQIRKG